MPTATCSPTRRRGKRCLNRSPIDRGGKPVFGVDLGGAVAMSAVAACWPTGRLETMAMFGGVPDLNQRALQDNAGGLYEAAFEAGELLVSRKRIPDIRHLMDEAIDRFGIPAAIIIDTWRLAELKDALEDDHQLRNIPVIERRQGFQDGSEAVRSWKKAIAQEAIYPVPPSGLLTYGLSEAVTVCDPAANEKLAKNTEGGRRSKAKDDIVAAALLAVEFGYTKYEGGEGGTEYGGLV